MSFFFNAMKSKNLINTKKEGKDYGKSNKKSR